MSLRGSLSCFSVLISLARHLIRAQQFLTGKDGRQTPLCQWIFVVVVVGGGGVFFALRFAFVTMVIHLDRLK